MSAHVDGQAELSAATRPATRARSYHSHHALSDTLSDVKAVRRCSRPGCVKGAVATLTYVYAESTAVVGPLATYSEPHSYDLCEVHASRLTVPIGWEVLRSEDDYTESGPSSDDLLALADAVREAARPQPMPPEVTQMPRNQLAGKGRRGHLRVVPPSS